MPLDRQPTLRGATLIARPLVAEDREGLYAVAGDPQLWALHPAPDRWRREQFEPFFAEALACGGAVTVTRHDGTPVGSSRYDNLDGDAQVEIGWTFLDRSLWGGPANRELKQLMLDHAFGAVERVVFRVGTDNVRSRRAVEKLGARLIGDTDIGGNPHVVYAIDRADWVG